MTFNYLDVCSGYSAATLAAQPLGWECAGYAEIDSFPSAILAARWGASRPRWMPDPEEPGLDEEERKLRRLRIAGLDAVHWGDRITNFGNFVRIGASDVGPIRLLVGGTPCQSFSAAGKRLGLDDPRGNLTLEFLALARRLRPDWLVWENVPGVLSHDEGRTLGTFLGLMGQLGYGWAYRVLDAQFIRVDGFEGAVPQRRRRVFVVGYLGAASAAAAVLFDRPSLRGDPRPRRTTPEDVAAALAASSGKRGGIGTDGHEGLIPEALPINIGFGGNRTSGPLDRAAALQAHGGPVGRQDFETDTFIVQGPAPIAFNSREDVDVSGNIAAALTSGLPQAQTIAFDTTQLTHPENRSQPKIGDPSPTLAKDGHPPAMASRSRAIATGWPGRDDVNPTLQARTQNAADATFSGVQQGWNVRRLTPVECERLQGVPDGFTHIEMARPLRRTVEADMEAYWRRHHPGLADDQVRFLAADGPRYKAIGNSMAVNAMRWIFRCVDEVDRILRSR